MDTKNNVLNTFVLRPNVASHYIVIGLRMLPKVKGCYMKTYCSLASHLVGGV